MAEPDWEAVKAYVLALLEHGLSSDLYYHGIHHTRDDVLPAVERLAALAGVDENDLLLLRTAALYHDTGYIEQYVNNEPLGARLAWETLANFGYTPAQIEAIVQMILATRMPQTPQNFLEALLCDADLDSLGREDYLETSHNLRAELSVYGTPISCQDWYRRQLNFLSSHTYFTEVARTARDAGKQANIRLLKELLAAVDAQS